jgi:hypothetical protein
MNYSLALVSPASQQHAYQEAPIAQRLVLYQGELYRIPTAYLLLSVKSGTAYVTQAGQDRILPGGHVTQLDAHADVALISALAGEPVIFELFQHADNR